MKSFLKNKIIPLFLAICLFVTTGCGTILHPERKGQTGGQIDPAIAILDGVGLLLFVIPGLIAFAIDFSNGTIYLPDTADSSFKQDFDRERAKSFAVNKTDLRKETVEEIIAQHTGKKVDLDNPNLQVTRTGDTAPDGDRSNR